VPEKTHHSVLSDAEILANFRNWQARQSQPGTFVPLRNDPHHIGVIDANYVRPAPSEFPKMVYRKSAQAKEGYITKIVASKEEQDALPKGWAVSTQDVHALLASLIPKPAEEAAAEEEDKPAAKGK